jgi:hypothetical protein
MEQRGVIYIYKKQYKKQQLSPDISNDTPSKAVDGKACDNANRGQREMDPQRPGENRMLCLLSGW